MAMFGKQGWERRHVLLGLLGLVIATPIARFWRIRHEDFVEKDGWVLRKDDLA